jgi:hypothetical protein
MRSRSPISEKFSFPKEVRNKHQNLKAVSVNAALGNLTADAPTETPPLFKADSATL